MAGTGIIGMILPTGCGFTQNTAETRVLGRLRLVSAWIGCSVVRVVEALPLRAETHRLIRYPSPDGRSCTGLCGSPLFCCISNSWASRRGVAQIHPDPFNRFDRRSRFALCAHINVTQTEWDKSPCEPCFSPLRGFQFSAACQAVARRFRNRRFSAPDQALPRRPFWMATSQPGLSLARQGTLRIASFIQAAVTDFHRAVDARTTLPCFQATGALRTGGFVFPYQRRSLSDRILREGT